MNECILVIDCGGTKCAWCAATPARVRHRIVTAGFNASVTPAEQIEASVIEGAAALAAEGFSPAEIHFYGAGCGTDAARANITGCLSAAFPGTTVRAESDLLGAARALFGHTPGIACILGTGSNSALYDGHDLAVRIPALGWALGDEGSGAYLGRLLVVSILRRTLPDAVIDAFQAEYNVTEADVIEAVYRRTGANAWLASFAPFLSANLAVPEVKALVVKAFEAFRDASVARYNAAARELFPGLDKPLELAVVGSVGTYFGSVLAEVMAPTPVRTLADPLEPLADFHCR